MASIFNTLRSHLVGILVIAATPISALHADVLECATTSMVQFRGGTAPQPLGGQGDTFTFDTVTGVQRILLADTPAARFLTPKGRVYAKRLESVRGDPIKAKTIIDEMMADKSIGAPDSKALEHKFDVLSSDPALSLSASAKSCVTETLCFGRFLTIRLPGEVIFQGQVLKSPVPAWTFMLVEGNMFTVGMGECKKQR